MRVQTLLDTVLRECIDLSLGVFCKYETLENRIKSKAYWIRLVLRIDDEKRNSAFRYLVTYVLPIPWDDEWHTRVMNLRSYVEELDRIVQEWKHVRPYHLFGDEEIGPISRVHKDTNTYVKVLRNATGPMHTTRQWTVSQDEHDTCEILQPTETSKDVLRWWALRDRLESMVFDHPAVHVCRDARWGLIQHVQVERDYLEKDQIRWWSVHDLNQVVNEGRGRIGNERFRPYFIPVLKSILQEIEQDKYKTLEEHLVPSCKQSTDDVLCQSCE